jgi:hypothetical protein
MKNLLLFVVIIACYNLVNAQEKFQRSIGANSGFDISHCLDLVSDTGYILAGSTNYFDTTTADVMLIRTNVNGDTLWAKTYDAGGSENAIHVQQTFDGGFIAIGTTQVVGNAFSEMYLIKTDLNGNLLWSKSYGDSIHIYSGFSVQQLNDSGFVLMGNQKENDVVIIRTNKDGDTIWTKMYNNFYMYSIQQTKDKGFILGGGLYVCLLIKLDSTGEIMWSKYIDTQKFEVQDIYFSARQTSDNGYIIAGSDYLGINTDQAYLAKTDSLGNLQWAKTYADSGSYSYSNSYATCVEQTIDKGYIFAGSIYLSNGDDLLVKTDSNGNVIWARHYGGQYNEKSDELIRKKCDNRNYYPTWVVPIKVQHAQIDNEYVFTSISRSFNNNYYLVRTDKNGISGTCYDNSLHMIVTPVSSVVINFALQAQPKYFIVRSPITVVKHPNVIDYDLCPVVVGEETVTTSNDKLAIYPNPSSSVITIETNELGTSKQSCYEIYNLEGDLMARHNISQARTSVDINSFAKGLYLIRLISGNSNVTVKFVKE